MSTWILVIMFVTGKQLSIDFDNGPQCYEFAQKIQQDLKNQQPKVLGFQCFAK